MKRTLTGLGMLAVMLVSSSGQSNKLPSDIDPNTLTRMPRVQRQDLDAAGQKIYDSLAGTSGRAPGGILAMGLYNPELAQALHMLHDSVTKDGTLGNHTNEVAILVATREERMSLNEWYGHEASALKAGVEPSVIDVIKTGKEPTGVPEKDAVVIRFGRQLFRDRHINSETFMKAEELFGKRGTVELIGVMGDYAMVGMMLQAVDQQLPDKPALPTLK